MLIIKILVSLLFIVLTSCTSSNVGQSVYGYNHPPLDENYNIPVAVIFDEEVRKPKSISFSNEVTTFHPRFSNSVQHTNVEITTVNSQINEDAPTKYRVIPAGFAAEQIPVAVVYDDQAENSKMLSGRRKIVAKSEKNNTSDSKLNNGEEKVAGKRRLASKIDNLNKDISEVIQKKDEKSTIEANNTSSQVRLSNKRGSTRATYSSVDSTAQCRSEKLKTEAQNNTKPVISNTKQTLQGQNTVKELKQSRQRGNIPKTDINLNPSDKTNKKVTKSNKSMTEDSNTEVKPSGQSSFIERMTKKYTDAKDDKEIKDSSRVIEKEIRNRIKKPIIPILESESYIYSHNGDFHYSYEGGDGTKAFEKGILKSVSMENSEEEQKGEAVEGGFSYKDKEGNDYSLTYTADENGYRPVGAHLPTPPPIPPAIARALAYLATKPTPVDGEVTKSWW